MAKDLSPFDVFFFLYSSFSFLGNNRLSWNIIHELRLIRSSRCVSFHINNDQCDDAWWETAWPLWPFRSGQLEYSMEDFFHID